LQCWHLLVNRMNIFGSGFENLHRQICEGWA
jgi:hypothetical protein